MEIARVNSRKTALFSEVSNGSSIGKDNKVRGSSNGNRTDSNGGRTGSNGGSAHRAGRVRFISPIRAVLLEN